MRIIRIAFGPARPFVKKFDPFARYLGNTRNRRQEQLARQTEKPLADACSRASNSRLLLSVTPHSPAEQGSENSYVNQRLTDIRARLPQQVQTGQAGGWIDQPVEPQPVATQASLHSPG